MSYRNKDSYTDYSVQVVRSTEKAILVKFLAVDKEGTELWIPKSVCQNSEHKLDDLEDTDVVELRIADWFAEKNGF